MLIEVELDRTLARHLASALARHRQALRSDEKACPEDLVRLQVIFDAAARGLISGPEVLRSAQERSGALTDQVMADYGLVIRQDQEFLSAAEAATVTGMGVSTIRRHFDSGELPSSKVGGARRVARTDLEAFMKGADRC